MRRKQSTSLILNNLNYNLLINLKICVNIVFYNNKNISNQTGKLKHNKIYYLKKIINSYLSINKNVSIFIHTNTFTNETKKISKIKNVNFIKYNLKNENPRYFPWKCRKFMEKKKNKYDIFIYSEDDILFTRKNLHYWLKYKDICISNNYNPGFLRYEISKYNEIYSTDIQKPLDKFLILNNNKYIVNDLNPFCAFWIMDQNEFKKFISSNIWKFNWKGKNHMAFYDPEVMSGIGWHGLNMTRYKATILPTIKNNLDPSCLIHHMPNNYVDIVSGFGNLKMKRVIKKKLIQFKEKNLINFFRLISFQFRSIAKLFR